MSGPSEECVPSLQAKKILQAQGLCTLWSTFSHALSQPKSALRRAKTRMLSERIMHLKRLMERLYVWLFHFQEYPYLQDLLMRIKCSLNAPAAIVPITILPFLFM